MTYTITQTRTAQPMGQYQPTELDARKAAAAFRLIACYGRKNAIVWHDGREQVVTDRKLVALQAAHTWATDF